MRKEPDNSVIINVCIIPEAVVANKCVEFSQALKSASVMFVLDGKSKFAHMTVFMARFADTEVGKILDVVRTVAGNAKNFACEHSGYFMTAGRYLEVSYSKSKELLALHESLLIGLKDYRINPGNPFEEAYFAPYTEEQKKNAEETGYDLARNLYRPHITLTRYRENMVPKFFPDFSRVDLSFRVNKICVYKADENGAVYELLGEFSAK